jgi:hypothetical protein
MTTAESSVRTSASFVAGLPYSQLDPKNHAGDIPLYPKEISNNFSTRSGTL